MAHWCCSCVGTHCSVQTILNQRFLVSRVVLCCCMTCREFENLFKPQSTQIVTKFLKYIYFTCKTSLSSWRLRISTWKMRRFLTPLQLHGLAPALASALHGLVLVCPIGRLLTVTALWCPFNLCKVSLTCSIQFLEGKILLNTFMISVKQTFMYLYWQAFNNFA